MTEITTRTERAAVETEPLVSLSQITGLLNAAADLARAERPVYIQPSTAPAVTVLPTGHPGIDVRFPSPAEAAGIVAPWAPLRHPAPVRFAWGVRLVYGGVALLLAGAAGAAVTDGNGIAVSAAVAGIGAVIGGTARATIEETRREQQS